MIDEKYRLKLIDLIEKQVVSLLIANGYVDKAGPDISWESVNMSDKAYELLNILESSNKENEAIIDSLMEIFPKKQLDSKKALLQRYEKFLQKTELKNITKDEVCEAARHWIKEKGDIYCGNLFYFFYKEDKKIYISRLENLIREIREYEANQVKINVKPIEADWAKRK